MIISLRNQNITGGAFKLLHATQVQIKITSIKHALPNWSVIRYKLCVLYSTQSDLRLTPRFRPLTKLPENYHAPTLNDQGVEIGNEPHIFYYMQYNLSFIIQFKLLQIDYGNRELFRV